MAEKKIVMIMDVKDATKKGLDSVKSSIAGARKSFNGDGDGKTGIFGSTDKLNQTLGKAGAAMAVIAAGATAVEIGIKGWGAASAYFSGDLEKQAKAIEDIDGMMKTLPFGFNKIYGIGVSIREGLSGEAAELEKINKETDARNARLETTKKLISDQKKLLVDLRNETSKIVDPVSARNVTIGDEALKAKLGKFDAARVTNDRDSSTKIGVEDRAVEAAQATIKKIQAELDSGNKTIDRDALESEKARLQKSIELNVANIVALQELHTKARREISAEEFKALNAESEAQQKRADAFKAIMSAGIDAQIKREQDLADKRKAIEDSITSTVKSATEERQQAEIEALRATGQGRRADLLALTQSYEAQVQAAKEAARKIAEDPNATQSQKDRANQTANSTIANLTQQRELRAGIAANGGDQTPGSLAMRSSRFLTGSSDQAPEAKMQKTLEELLALGRRQLAIEETRQRGEQMASDEFRITRR
jgi:hypothetical protein